MKETLVFTLAESAFERGSEYDVVMLYQVLLGRNPENSAVIQNHRTAPLSAAFHTFVSSPEFRDKVMDPVLAGAPMRSHDMNPRPSEDQLAWLFTRTVLDEGQKRKLRDAEDWEQFFAHLLNWRGFLDPPPAPPRHPPRAVPFKPNARPLAARLATPAPAPAQAPGPTNAELMAKLDAIELLLQQLQPAAAKPSKSRQAP